MDDFLVMTHDEARLVKGTFDGMVRSGKGPEFARAFYRHLFALAPEVRDWFPKDMVEQNRKLVRTLGLLLGNLPEWHDIIGPVRALGPQHGPFPIEPRHFEAFVTCLFKAMEDVTGAPMVPDVSIPFRMAFLRIGAEMMRATKRAL